MIPVYEAPALKSYGSVRALTASGVKCTPGSDGGFADLGSGLVLADGKWHIDTDGDGVADITKDFDQCKIKEALSAVFSDALGAAD